MKPKKSTTGSSNSKIVVKGIHRVRKRLADGTVTEYHYAWRGGPKFWSTADDFEENSPEYLAAYREVAETLGRAKGKFRSIIITFLESSAFTKLSARTQSDMKKSLWAENDGIEVTFGEAPVAAFNQPRIRGAVYKWHDSMASDRVADARLTHLVRIVYWAVDRGIIKQHHLTKMNKRYSSDRSEIVWTEAEIDAIANSAPTWVARIIIAATETGLRPGDLIKLSRTHLQQSETGLRIVMKTNKRQKYVAIPVTPKMQQLIDDTPKDRLHILAMEGGDPFTRAPYLQVKIGEWRNKLGLRKELHLYDARGTAATRLLDAGLGLKDIALHMGWSLEHAGRMLETYAAMNPQISREGVARIMDHKKSK